MAISAAPPTPRLDHVVILVPHAFLTSPPAWLSDGRLLSLSSTIGRHADGLTENVLAPLPDGAYVEFVAFVPGADRTQHRWGGRAEGAVVDWALSLPSSPSPPQDEKRKLEELAAAFEPIQERVRNARNGIYYPRPLAGGRGDVKWAVSSPRHESNEAAAAVPIAPGQLPFFCLDVTARAARVPQSGGEGGAAATGVAGLVVRPDGKFKVQNVAAVYDALLGKRVKDDKGEVGWRVGKFGGGEPAVVKYGSGSGGERAWEGDEEVRVVFHTDKDEFKGKTVGGEVGGGERLQFEFVGL